MLLAPFARPQAVFRLRSATRTQIRCHLRPAEALLVCGVQMRFIQYIQMYKIYKCTRFTNVQDLQMYRVYKCTRFTNVQDVQCTEVTEATGLQDFKFTDLQELQVYRSYRCTRFTNVQKLQMYRLLYIYILGIAANTKNIRLPLYARNHWNGSKRVAY
jgi:hypothetical protein